MMSKKIRQTISYTIIVILLFSTIQITTGFSNHKTKNIDDNKIFSDLKIKTLMKIGNYPSFSVCIIKNQDIIVYKSYGFSDIYKLKKPTKNTVYPVGSISKTITATALMQLYEKGYFKLEDDINKYLNFSVRNPRYPDTPITFKMLLSHQSSLNGSARAKISYLRYLLLCQFPFSNNIIHLPDYPYPWIKEYVNQSGCLYSPSIWRDYAPGEHPCYSNINTILLEHIIERFTNQSFEEYCKENIFDVLDMKNTSFHFIDLKDSDIAKNYLIKLLGFYIPYPKIDTATASGGLKTSVEDLSHFLIAHMNGGVWKDKRILNQTTIDLMHSKQYPESPDGFHYYGLGWEIYSKKMHDMIFQGHDGNIIGGAGTIKMNQTNKIGIILMCNRGVINDIQINAWDKIEVELLKNNLR